MQLDVAQLEALIDGGLQNGPADVVIRGGKLLDVYRGTWVDGDLAIRAGRIVSFGGRHSEAERAIDATGQWVVPGFFESHYHAGGTHMAPGPLARALLERGTTSTVCDFQEFYVVAGPNAVRHAIDESWEAGIRLFYLAPIHWLVINDLASPSQKMRTEDLLEMLTWPETVAINEPPPGPVLAKDPGALEVIAAVLNAGKIFTGHAPAMSGPRLQAYMATGASSDHESVEADEAWAKLAYGMKVMMRQGSAAPDMERLISLAVEHPEAARHMMLCSDEVDPTDLQSRGHLDYKVRRAIERGVDPFIAYQMVTLNPAEYYRIDHLVGSLAPGRFADVVILDDVEQCSVAKVLTGGRLVSELPPLELDYPEDVRAPVRFDTVLEASDFRIPSNAEATVRVIGVPDGSLISTADEAVLQPIGGSLAADPRRDVLKMAVIDRAGGTDMALGFVSGFGIGEAAVATTYAHTFYNVLVVGGSDAAMAQAANAVAEMGGGVAVVSDGQVVARWCLDLVGVFSTAPLEQVGQDFEDMNKAIRALGCDMAAPLLALSFAALPTIPTLGMTTEGLYHVERREYLDVIVRR